MPAEASFLLGLAISLVVVYLATPFAIRLADRLQFYDYPVGFKRHAAPTPYLGGAAVVAGFLIAVVLVTEDWRRTLPVVAGVLVLWVVGTVDDRRTVRPAIRLSIELALAALLWQMDLGWQLGLGSAADLAITAFWVIAVVNAFNLFDNMDGAASSMACVVAACLALLGVGQGDIWLSVAGAALCGACIGFLPHNLSSPARIFLGDGGSMPIGFAVAALAMIGMSDAAPAWQALALGLLFVGIPALDTCLVIVSRRRRGVSIMTGGRDHLTHRAQQRLRTARAVALALGGAQAIVSALAIMALEGGSVAVVAAVALYVVGIGVVIAALDTGIGRARTSTAGAAGDAMLAPRPGWSTAALLLPLVAVLAASPFFSGYYDSELWVRGGVVIVLVLTAGVIARPPRMSPPAVVALVGLAGLACWSLASAAWAESAEQAVAGGNRLLVYAALLGLALVLVRSDRAALWLIGGLGVGALVVAGVTVVRMLGAEPQELFINGRLHSPLGYINGQGAIYLLALWPLLAFAEQRRSAALAGVAMAGATVLGSLLLLSQSRGIALATALTVVVVLGVVPGRLRRAWALVVLAGAIAFAAPALLDVYETGRTGALPAATVHAAARAVLIAAAAAGVAWWAIAAVVAMFPAVARLRPATIGVLAAGAVAGAAVAAVESRRIADTIERQYASFVRLGAEPSGAAAEDASSSRLLTGAGNRYDYWRIAWRAWREHPVLGIGAGNYDKPYFRERATTEHVRQPHSLELQTLSELGLVGAVWLAVLIAGLGWGAARLARVAGSSAAARLLAVAAIGGATAWLLHTSVDWLHLLPGVTGLAIVFAAVLVRSPGADERRSAAAERLRVAPSWRRLLPAVAAACFLAVAGVSLSRQGLAEHFRLSAEDALAADPVRALEQADRSLRLDAEAVPTYYVKAAALARYNQPAAARATLEEAARREPGDYVTWSLLGDLAVRSGDLRGARRAYARAVRLNPRDPTLQQLARNPEAAGLPSRDG